MQYLLEKPRALRAALWVKRRLDLVGWSMKGKAGQPTPHRVKQKLRITAHGAKGSPILEELQAVLGSMRVPYVILVDDARLFG